MTDSIFSRYSQGENHITSTFLAVLKQLSLHNMDYLISAMLGDAIELVEFKNQPSLGNPGVPDAEITANIRILIETKVVRNTIYRGQLDRHILGLKESSNGYLFILTPDKDQPKIVNELIKDLDSKGEKPQVAWASFAQLSGYIDNLITERVFACGPSYLVVLREGDLPQSLAHSDAGLEQVQHRQLTSVSSQFWAEFYHCCRNPYIAHL